MERRRLGRTEREVTVVGLGGKGLTGARRGLEPPEVQRAVAAAIEAGCELIDLSAPRSAGDAEKRVGDEVRALRARDRVVVATAAGVAGRRPPAPGQVQRQVEDSLRALRLDGLPLVWLTGWDDGWLADRTWPELAGTLARLVREGKVLAWGAVLADDVGAARPADDPPATPPPLLVDLWAAVAAAPPAPPPPARVLAEPWLAAVQVRHSLFDRRVEDALLPAAQQAGVAVVVREPLAGGALGGQLGPDTHFLPGDERLAIPADRWRALVPELARLARLVRTTPPAAAATEEGNQLLEALRRAPDVEQFDVAELALRFALAHPAVTAVIPGARTPAHVLANVTCADGRPLPPGVRAALDERPWCPAWYDLAPPAPTPAH